MLHERLFVWCIDLWFCRQSRGPQLTTSELRPNQKKTFMIKLTTPEEIEDVINKIDTSMSTGPNSIPIPYFS